MTAECRNSEAVLDKQWDSKHISMDTNVLTDQSH
jgi:hypothetical protein